MLITYNLPWVDFQIALAHAQADWVRSIAAQDVDSPHTKAKVHAGEHTPWQEGIDRLCEALFHGGEDDDFFVSSRIARPTQTPRTPYPMRVFSSHPRGQPLFSAVCPMIPACAALGPALSCSTRPGGGCCYLILRKIGSVPSEPLPNFHEFGCAQRQRCGARVAVCHIKDTGCPISSGDWL